MANPNKQKGTAWESLIVAYLRDHHNDAAHRNAQMGRLDIGDIDGYYLHAVEAKAERTITLSSYIAQANREAVHAGQPFGCAVVKRRMRGAADGYVVRDVATDVRLMNRFRDAEELLREYQFDVWFEHDAHHRESV
ncbi:hypothetical protein [Streptomyces sp. NPDC102264]|uniref:hypothetical protein n=1 Tax=Streptomyces sp. NPDC102264 TaxID=3366149 RepID=UPI00380D456C